MSAFWPGARRLLPLERRKPIGLAVPARRLLATSAPRRQRPSGHCCPRPIPAVLPESEAPARHNGSDMATNAYGSLLDDLRAEGEELDALVAPLDATQWAAPTPAGGWTIAHQIAHLAWSDARAHLAATEPAAFEEEARAEISRGWTGVDGPAAARRALRDRRRHSLRSPGTRPRQRRGTIHPAHRAGVILRGLDAPAPLGADVRQDLVHHAHDPEDVVELVMRQRMPAASSRVVTVGATSPVSLSAPIPARALAPSKTRLS